MDLWVLVDREWQYKVVVINKRGGAGRVAAFHDGLGYQEKISGV